MKDTNDPAVQDAINDIQSKTSLEPAIALILGSGLGSFADEVQQRVIIPTEEISGYPVSTVPGHAGKLVFGYVNDIPVMVVQGRVHYYEGYQLADVVYPVRIAARLGAKALVVTNAAGAVDKRLSPGDLMLIEDHINMMGNNPLIGQQWGFEKFPDMSRAYDPDLRDAVARCAEELQIELKSGILGAWMGPSYETASEIRFLSGLGVSAACMSTVPEVIAAARLRLKTVGISAITNMGTGISENPLTHDEVTIVAGKIENKFRTLLKHSIPLINN